MSCQFSLRWELAPLAGLSVALDEAGRITAAVSVANWVSGSMLLLGRYGEAEAEHRQALAIRERLAHDFPTIPDYRNDLARVRACVQAPGTLVHTLE